VPASLGSVLERLRSHGIRLERLDQPTTVSLEEFHIAASQVAAQAFEKHQERTVTGQYEPIERTMPEGTYRIPMKQPLARLAFYLLEPQSSDGLLTWNVLDQALIGSNLYPIVRSRD
jgi:hypothetical protein